MIKYLKIMQRSVKKQTCKSNKRGRNRLAKVKSRFDPRRVPCKNPEVEKHLEAEMIKCFKLALYQSSESRMKKKQFTEDSVSIS